MGPKRKERLRQILVKIKQHADHAAYGNYEDALQYVYLIQDLAKLGIKEVEK